MARLRIERHERAHRLDLPQLSAQFELATATEHRTCLRRGFVLRARGSLRASSGQPQLPHATTLRASCSLPPSTLVRPLLFALDPERAHELTLKSLEAGIYPRSARRRTTRGWLSRRGADVSQSARHRRGLRQGRARVRGRARHGPRLRRDRHRHPAAAGRQSAPAAVPPRRRARADQPARLQQRRSRRGAGPAAAPPPAGHRRRQRRRQQGRARPQPPTTSRASAASTTWRATSPSTSPRPTRRACATCRRRPRSTICWRACWRRASEMLADGPAEAADRRQARARHRRGRPRAGGRGAG